MLESRMSWALFLPPSTVARAHVDDEEERYSSPPWWPLTGCHRYPVLCLRLELCVVRPLRVERRAHSWQAGGWYSQLLCQWWCSPCSRAVGNILPISSSVCPGPWWCRRQLTLKVKYAWHLGGKLSSSHRTWCGYSRSQQIVGCSDRDSASSPWRGSERSVGHRCWLSWMQKAPSSSWALLLAWLLSLAMAASNQPGFYLPLVPKVSMAEL